MRNIIIWHWFIKNLVDTWRRNDVDATSLRRIDVITTSCAYWEFGPPPWPPQYSKPWPPQYSKPSYAYANLYMYWWAVRYLISNQVTYLGWSGGHCWVNFQCRRVLLILIILEQGPSALAVGEDGVSLDIFSLFHFSSFFLGDIDRKSITKSRYKLRIKFGHVFYFFLFQILLHESQNNW